MSSPPLPTPHDADEERHGPLGPPLHKEPSAPKKEEWHDSKEHKGFEEKDGKLRTRNYQPASPDFTASQRDRKK